MHQDETGSHTGHAQDGFRFPISQLTITTVSLVLCAMAVRGLILSVRLHPQKVI